MYDLLSDADKRPATVSVGVGRETTSVISPKQPARSTTLGDEYVSYLNDTNRCDCLFLKKYEGDTYAEKKHGSGVLSWSDGRMYTGAFYADKRHGFGTYQTADISEFKVKLYLTFN